MPWRLLLYTARGPQPTSMTYTARHLDANIESPPATCYLGNTNDRLEQGRSATVAQDLAYVLPYCHFCIKGLRIGR